MPFIPKSSYYDKNYRQTPALIRARRPYLVKNALTGLSIFIFVTGVYSWTINAVSQDEFEDVKVPSAPSMKNESESK
ncbi:Cytochrome c oxidase assembly factor 3, mitochondrial [Golovinomyces cichoracearum]|uniref:Cytochrome c oxidase assembly factor 3 n=1 Tax=Golovinomyces cichoracearum TaxID=62708 RepID=A0A420IRT9_9PEZI|nr:Cytochrome c oxidase assembly factor 3, mitochondrial [Golovinomyces cichoracearum]RKF77249.1 Cytochrome c oxidase assembly factor 3, mitochondrial [Golovinomyces cichoracearum]